MARTKETIHENLIGLADMHSHRIKGKPIESKQITAALGAVAQEVEARERCEEDLRKRVAHLEGALRRLIDRIGGDANQ